MNESSLFAAAVPNMNRNTVHPHSAIWSVERCQSGRDGPHREGRRSQRRRVQYWFFNSVLMRPVTEWPRGLNKCSFSSLCGCTLPVCIAPHMFSSAPGVPMLLGRLVIAGHAISRFY